MFNSGNKQAREDLRDTTRYNDMGGRTAGAVIGEGTHVDGSIRVNGPLRVDGEIQGGSVITTDQLTVGAKGQIKADLAAKQAVISGTVNGKIRAQERVELLAGAHVRGDVYAQSFKIEDGVFFHGTCVMGDAAASEIEAALAPALKPSPSKSQRGAASPSGTSGSSSLSGTSPAPGSSVSSPALADKRAA